MIDLTTCTHQHSTPPGAALAITLTIQCAWCLTEQGRPLLGSDSHGICKTHAALMLAAWRARKGQGKQ